MKLDKFYIAEEAPPGSTYVYTEHEINIPYNLNIGDMVFNIGWCNYNAEIIDIANTGVLIKARYNKEILISFDKLKVFPFGMFKKGINKKNFRAKAAPDINNFVLSRNDYNFKTKQYEQVYLGKEHEEEVKRYMDNFKNIIWTRRKNEIVVADLGVAKIVQQRDSIGQYKFIF